MEQWSNSAVLGYIIIGLERKGKSEEEITEVIRAVRSQFDWISVDEAADRYNKSAY